MGLRASLARITRSAEAGAIDEVLTAMADLKKRWPHSVDFVEPGDPRVNCFMYALGISLLDEALELAMEPERDLGRNCLSDAVRLLIEFGLVERLSADCGPNSLALYSWRKVPQHMGVTVGRGRVRSKWGQGSVWEHALLEVPVTYGCPAGYFRVPSKEMVADALRLLAFAKGTLPTWDREERVTSLAVRLGLQFGKGIGRR